jgi:hypothetical protein
MLRRENPATSWFDFACSYVDMKWPRAAGKYRKSIAEALTSVTMAILGNGPDGPDDLTLRSALFNHAFNTNQRNSEAPAEVMHALVWARNNSPPVVAIAQPGAARSILDALAMRLDALARGRHDGLSTARSALKRPQLRRGAGNFGLKSGRGDQVADTSGVSRRRQTSRRQPSAGQRTA